MDFSKLKLGHGYVAISTLKRDKQSVIEGFDVSVSDFDSLEPNGTVLAIGDYGTYNSWWGNLLVEWGILENPIFVEVGDEVLFNPNRAVERFVDGEVFYLVHYSAIEAAF